MSWPVHHVGINVSSLETAIPFYCRHLGFVLNRRFQLSETQSEVVGVEGVEGEIALLEKKSGCNVELIEYTAPPGNNIHQSASGHDVGVAHICLEVDDVDARYRELRDDVDFLSSPQTTNSGPNIVYLRDPDGNFIELLEGNPTE